MCGRRRPNKRVWHLLMHVLFYFLFLFPGYIRSSFSPLAHSLLDSWIYTKLIKAFIPGFQISDSKWFKVIQSNSYQFKVIQSETSDKWLVWLWQLVPFGGKLERWYLWKASIKSKTWFSEKYWFIWNFDSVIIWPRFLCARVILVQISEKVK